MEYWDIYDRGKHVTGRRMIRNDWHMKPGDYHLTVLALIRDRAGRILITHGEELTRLDVSQRMMVRFPFITTNRKKVVEHETGTAERAVD